LAAALLLDTVLLFRLIRPRTDEIVFEPLVIRSAPRIVTRTSNDAELMREAKNRMPFGGTAAPTVLATSVAQQAPIVRMPRLLGTVVEGRAGFVVLEMPDSRLQVVRNGERAGDLRLRSIAAGEAVFEDHAGVRITLRSPTAGTETRP
jgi:hypothetical protein